MSTLASVVVRDLFANRPAAGIAGRLFFASDTGNAYRDNGSSWDTITAGTGLTNPMTTAGDLIVGGSSGTPGRLAAGTSGNVLTSNGPGVAPSWQAASGGSSFPGLVVPPAGITAPPSVSSLTAVNQSTSTFADTASGIFMSQPAAATQYIAALVKAVPGVAYTFTVGMLPIYTQTNYQAAGICLTDGTGFVTFTLEYANSPVIIATKWAGFGTYTADYTSTAAYANVLNMPQAIWLRIQDDGTNRKTYWSWDGFNWNLLNSVSRTDFITPTQLGVCVKTQNATYPATAAFFSWLVTTP